MRLGLVALLVAVLFPTLTPSASADGVYREGGIVYLTSGCCATVTGYDDLGEGAEVSIPETVTVDNVPHKVTAIGASAFLYKALRSVTIPNSVTSIGDKAFYDDELTSVTIPDSVTSIGASAFSSNQLTSVTIPDSVTSFGDDVFQFNQLTSVTIPDSVSSIGSYAFAWNRLTSVTIPDSVSIIEDGVFLFNQLTTVTIPDSVSSIGSDAFAFNDLTSVTIPDSVMILGHKAFTPNPLTRITFEGQAAPKGVTDAFERGAYVLAPSSWVFPSKICGAKVHFAPVPSTPRITSVVAGDGQISLTMSPPTSTGGLKLRGYHVSLDNGVTWEAPHDSSTATFVLIKELTDGKNYKVQVCAVNSSGCSAATKTVSVTPGVASAPIVVAHIVVNKTFSIKIGLPTSDGGSPVTSYQYSTDTGATWLPLSTKATVSLTAILKNSAGSAFGVGKKYSIIVRAKNKYGYSANSAAVTFTR